MLQIKIERFLWPWEKPRFKRLVKCVQSSDHQYVCRIRDDVLKILERKYKVGEGSGHIWIHRKNSFKRLAIVYRTD